VIEIEALAARRAMELALEIDLDNIVFKGDNEPLFKALRVETGAWHSTVTL